MEEKIKKFLEEEVKPMLGFHGGDVEFAEFEKESGVLKIKLKGACFGCMMSEMTLEGIENHIKEKIPAVKKVEAV